MTESEMLEARRVHAMNTKKDEFARFSLGEPSKIRTKPDKFSKSQRERLNDAKDRLCYPGDDGDLW